MSTKTQLLENKYSTATFNALRPVVFVVGWIGAAAGIALLWSFLYISTYEVLYPTGAFDAAAFPVLFDFAFAFPLVGMWGGALAVVLRRFGYSIAAWKGAIIAIAVLTVADAVRLVLVV